MTKKVARTSRYSPRHVQVSALWMDSFIICGWPLTLISFALFLFFWIFPSVVCRCGIHFSIFSNYKIQFSDCTLMNGSLLIKPPCACLGIYVAVLPLLLIYPLLCLSSTSRFMSVQIFRYFPECKIFIQQLFIAVFEISKFIQLASLENSIYKNENYKSWHFKKTQKMYVFQIWEFKSIRCRTDNCSDSIIISIDHNIFKCHAI